MQTLVKKINNQLPMYFKFVNTMPQNICFSLQNVKVKKWHNSLKINQIFLSKVNWVIYSLTKISSPSFKALTVTFIEISCWQEKHIKQMDEQQINY